MSRRNKGAPVNAAEWLAEARKEKLTASRRAALTDWLRESPTHVCEFLQMTLIQEDLGKLKVSPEQIEAWISEAKAAASEPTRISSNVQLSSAGAISFPGKLGDRGSFIGRWRLGWLSAACLAAALFAGGFIYKWEEGRYTTAFGEQRIVTLADGSVIELNTDSALQVRLTEKLRAIRMIKGEAFFRVAHDASRPFVVSAHEADVKAVGTQFNVRLSSDITLVSVIEGTVEVRADTPPGGTSPAAESAVRVTRGEEASITSTRSTAPNTRIEVAKVTRPSPQRAASWTRGRVEFEDMPLSNVLSEFQRYRNVQVSVDDESLRQLKLTGSFDAHDPNSALAFIATLPDIIVEQTEAHTYRIHRKKIPPGM